MNPELRHRRACAFALSAVFLFYTASGVVLALVAMKHFAPETYDAMRSLIKR